VFPAIEFVNKLTEYNQSNIESTVRRVIMKLVRVVVIDCLCQLILAGSVYAENNELEGLKPGFGFDHDFGLDIAIGVRYQF
jgi:hypothetical protein